jgi:hypothetical protein
VASRNSNSPHFELARVLLHLGHVAAFIINRDNKQG